MMELIGQVQCAVAAAIPTMLYGMRIGVTGHRNLVAENVPAIGLAVRGLLDRIEQILIETSVRPQAYAEIKPTALQQWSAWLGERTDSGLVELLRRVWRAVPINLRVVPQECQTPFRWVVVSPLAKGADRIVAREVLARQPSAIDPERVPPRLEVVLPMPFEKYREEFKDLQDREEFYELFAKASWTNQDDEFVPTDVQHGPLRNAAYRPAGHGVVNAAAY